MVTNYRRKRAGVLRLTYIVLRTPALGGISTAKNPRRATIRNGVRDRRASSVAVGCHPTTGRMPGCNLAYFAELRWGRRYANLKEQAAREFEKVPVKAIGLSSWWVALVRTRADHRTTCMFRRGQKRPGPLGNNTISAPWFGHQSCGSEWHDPVWL